MRMQQRAKEGNENVGDDYNDERGSTAKKEGCGYLLGRNSCFYSYITALCEM